ncbi:MAG: hypothetical protein WBP45_09405, partial [Daejeonella sp.]
GVTNEHIRNLIRDMILHHACCIGSILWGNGYWIIQNEAELEMTVRSLKQRGQGVLQRSEALEQSFQNKNNE